MRGDDQSTVKKDSTGCSRPTKQGRAQSEHQYNSAEVYILNIIKNIVVTCLWPTQQSLHRTLYTAYTININSCHVFTHFCLHVL